MTLKESIELTVDYIETHIHDVITADSLSKEVGYSKFYMHRIFQIYTGYTLMEYVRKRKLNSAAAEVKTNKRLLDIALDYGYGSERSFSRAFTKEFGKSPSYYRHKPVCGTKKLKVYDLSLPRKEWLEKMKSYLSDIKYETLDEMTVISGKRIGAEPEEEIIGVMTEFAKKNDINVKRTFGFDVPVDEQTQNKGHRGYEYWLVVDQDVKIDKTEFKLKTIPSYKYVSLRIDEPFENPFEKIPNGWKTLVAWLEDNQVLSDLDKDTALNCLEEVIMKDHKTVMDIYIPIKKA